MKEIGKIIDKKGNIIVVELTPSSFCSNCSLCHKERSEKFILEAINQCSANIGDIVSIEISKSSYYKATILVYIIPLFFFLVFILIGYLIGNNLNKDPQLFGLILGILGLVFSFFFVRFLDERIQKKSLYKYLPVAKEIVQR